MGVVAHVYDFAARGSEEGFGWHAAERPKHMRVLMCMRERMQVVSQREADAVAKMEALFGAPGLDGSGGEDKKNQPPTPALLEYPDLCP